MLPTNKIEIRIIKPHERQQVLDFLRVYYYLEEPLTVCNGNKQQCKEDEDFNLSYIDQGMSLMAVETNDSNSKEKIMGVILAGPKGPDEATHLFEEAAKFGHTKWGRTLHLLACVERDANIFERFNVRRALHAQILAVSSEMRGQNIGKLLIDAFVDLARCLNYEIVSTDCTSFYSARLLERMGFQCVSVKHYKDYVDETGKQVFNPDLPHTCVRTFASKL